MLIWAFRRFLELLKTILLFFTIKKNLVTNEEPRQQSQINLHTVKEKIFHLSGQTKVSFYVL